MTDKPGKTSMKCPMCGCTEFQHGFVSATNLLVVKEKIRDARNPLQALNSNFRLAASELETGNLRATVCIQCRNIQMFVD